MDKFQDAYREAVKKLPELHMDVGKVQDELHHYRMVKQGRKYLVMKGCTAAAVFLLCGAGTVAAKNFRDSIVKVSESGFVISSGQTMEEDRSRDEGSSGEMAGIPDTASILKIGGVSSIEDDVPEEPEVVEYDPQLEEYDSLEAFFKESSVVVAVPDSEMLGVEFTDERVDVLDGGKNVFVILQNEDVYFSLTQSDNRGYESYSSATSYMGESRNERSFTNSQGLNYVMIDSVDEKEEILAVHAAISVNGRDLTISFYGFHENVIERVLYNLDLSVYFQE